MAKIPCEYDQSSDIANYIGGGVRFKHFRINIRQSFVADTTYTFTLADFGFNGITPKGFAMSVIAGDSTTDYKGTLFYTNGAMVYRCGAANSTLCIFDGIVFY